MPLFGKKKQAIDFKYPGKHRLMNGSQAVAACEKQAVDAISIHSITPQSELLDYWQQQSKDLNISRRPVITVDAADDSAAATTAAGLALSGLRSSLICDSGQSITAMSESLTVSAGKRLPFVLHLFCQSVSKASSNTYCSHDGYHVIDDTGFIQFFARNNQAVADLTVIAHNVAELSLNPVAVAQDSVLTSMLSEPLFVPENELIQHFLGLASDTIESPTAAQQLLFGQTRRRIPEIWNLDQAVKSGGVQQADSYMQTVSGQRPFFFAHTTQLIDQCFNRWFELTGRRYRRINHYHCDDAEYLIIAQGSVLNQLEATVDYLRQYQKIKVGMVNLTVFRPFPGDLMSQLLKGRLGVTVLERTEQPLAEDLPLIRDIRACIGKSVEQGRLKKPTLTAYANYTDIADIPPLYSACFGLGGQDITIGDIIASVENMLPTGQQQNFFYLGINFTHSGIITPQQEIQQQAIVDAYPDIDRLALKPSPDNDLTDSQITTIRIHSIGGGRIQETLSHLVQVCFQQFKLNLSLQLQAEVRSQPCVSYLTINDHHLTQSQQRSVQTHFVNAAIILDKNCFLYADPLVGLNKQGTLVIQTTLTSNLEVWQSLPPNAQKIILNQQIQVFYINVSQLMGAETKLQTIVFQALFIKSVLIKAIPQQSETDVLSTFTEGWSESEVALFQTSYQALKPLETFDMTPSQSTSDFIPLSSAPLAVRNKPANQQAIADIHRFWNQTAYQYNLRQPNLADPFTALGITPAATSLFADMSKIRQQHPVWQAELCTACGQCYSVCPDSAVSGLINTVNEVFETNIKRIEKSGHTVKHLRRAIRQVEKKYHVLTETKSVGTTLDPIFAKAIGDTIKEYAEPEKAEVAKEFEWFKQVIGSFKFALTEPYHDEMNSQMPKNGGLFSITINPDSCKGCMECVSVCEPAALSTTPQTSDSVKTLQDNWNYWLDLPTSNKKYSQIDNLQTKQGVLNTLLLDKTNYQSLYCADTCAAGHSEKTAIHLLTSTVTALMQPRVEQHIKQIRQTITDLEKHIRIQLANTLDISDIDALETAIDDNAQVDLTLARLSHSLDQKKPTQPIDSQWLKKILQLITQLKELVWNYTQGPSGEGRSKLGITEGYRSTAQRIASFPYNPYPFPWANHLSDDAPALAQGVFEGQMLKMAEGFKALRIAELEINGRYDPSIHDPFFDHFDWRQFNEREYDLCPPLISVNAEGIGSQSGLHNLSHSLSSGLPVKLLVLDNQIPNDIQQPRKQLALLAMAHRNCFVQQSSLANINHLLEGFVDGLNYRGAALWTIYTSEQPKGDYIKPSFMLQSRLAAESRAYPLLSFIPDAGTSWEQSITLAANPDLDQDWIFYTLDYTDEYGNQFSKDLPLTYADWALTEPKYRNHFTLLEVDDKLSDELLLAEYLNLDSTQTVDTVPFIWATHPRTNHLVKLSVSTAMVEATRQCLDFWHMLKDLSGDNRVEIDTQAIADQARSDMAHLITEGLMSMVNGDTSALTRLLTEVPAVSSDSTNIAVSQPKKVEPTPKVETKSTPKAPKQDTDKQPGKTGHEPVWIETPDCTTCDECVEIAPAIFQYNDEKKAIVIDPTAGTYEQIVRSAEKCTAVIIHPGTPWNPDEPNLEKLIKRAEKFQ